MAEDRESERVVKAMTWSIRGVFQGAEAVQS